MTLTLWRDPRDCGLRVERGEWRSPRDAHESDRLLFGRVTAHTEAHLALHVGDMMPEHPGEWSVVEVPEEAYPRS